MLLVLAIVSTSAAALRGNPKRWPEGYSVVPFYVISAVSFALMVLNLALANLGLLLLLLVGTRSSRQHFRFGG